MDHRPPKRLLIGSLAFGALFLFPSPSSFGQRFELAVPVASEPQPRDTLPDPGGGDAPPEITTSTPSLDLRAEMEEILVATGNQQGTWAAMAISLDQGDTLLAMNADSSLVPASNQKLLTTVAALSTLGPDFRYQTFLLSSGEIRGDTLWGDLVLYGTGDPTLSDRFYDGETAAMDSLARMVVEAGIQEIQGDLVVDGSYFSGPTLHPEWDPRDLNDAFAAPISAVSFNENIVTVRVEAGAASGIPPMVHVLPPGSEIPVSNVAETAPRGTRSRVWLFRETPADPIGIEGEIPVGGRDVWRQLPVPDPLHFTGRHLEKALEAQGIQVRGRVRTTSDPSLSVLPDAMSQVPLNQGPLDQMSPKVIGVLTSPPLIDILRVVNKESNNLMAETVARTLGRVTLGDGSFRGGMEAVQRFLVREVGVPEDQILLRDGSGLSAQNRVSAGVLIRLLRFVADSQHWDVFWDTLPEAGVRRELGRMSGTPASRNLRAKTGTMDRVSALSGMVRTEAGERILFSILANGVRSEYRAKRAEDRLGIRLSSLDRPFESLGSAGPPAAPPSGN